MFGGPGFSLTQQSTSGSTGFNFGAAKTTTTTTPFNFPSASTGLNFGATSNPSAAGTAPAQATGFGFGAASSATAAPAFGFNNATAKPAFGSATNSFGQSSGATAAFGQTAQSAGAATMFGQPQQNATNLFGQQSGTAATGQAQQSGANLFAQQQQGAGGGFSFGATTSQAAATMPSGGFQMSFGSTAPTQEAAKPAGGFSLNPQPPNAQASQGFAFPAAATTKAPESTGFTLGGGSGGFNLSGGQKPVGGLGGFSFGSTTQASSAPAQPAPTLMSSSLATNIPKPLTISASTGFDVSNLGGTNKSGGLPKPFANFPAPAGVMDGDSQNAAASKPAGGLVLGPQTTTVAPATAALGGISFGSTAAASPKPPGFNFGPVAAQPPAATTAVAVTQSASARVLNFTQPAATSASGLGNLLAQSATAKNGAVKPLTVAVSAPPAAAAAATQLNLAKTISTTANLPFASFATAKTAVVTTKQNTSTVASLSTTTTVSSSQALPNAMKFRELEEQINKWSIDLEEHEKVYIQQATQINAWDKILMENGMKITQLDQVVERIEREHQRVEQELDFVLAQHKELEEMLRPLEHDMEQLGPISHHQHADMEREQTFKMAENVDAQLKRMGQDLKEIIDFVNTANANVGKTNPKILFLRQQMHQVASILNAHIDSLQWIQTHSTTLQKKVEEVTRLAEAQKREVLRVGLKR